MLMRFFALYTTTVCRLLLLLVNFVGYTFLEKTGTNFYAFGIETEHHETEEEHAMEKNMNVENGFSPVQSYVNVTKDNDIQLSDLSLSNLESMGSPVFGNLSLPLLL